MHHEKWFQGLFIYFICWVSMCFMYLGIYEVNSDIAIFPLTAIHLMRGEPFPLFFYGQDYMGTFPVLFIFLLFKIFGISHLLVEIFITFIMAGTITVFALFLMNEVGFFAAAVFATVYALFPQAVMSIYTLANGAHNEGIFLGVLTGYIFCGKINNLIKKEEINLKRVLTQFFILLVLMGLTYWCSKLGFLYLFIIITAGIFGCRSVLRIKLKPLVLNGAKAFGFFIQSIRFHARKNIKKLLFILFLILIVFLAHLYYDNKPPPPEEIKFKNSIAVNLEKGNYPEVAVDKPRLNLLKIIKNNIPFFIKLYGHLFPRT